MPIQFTCPVCNHALSAPDRFAGKPMRCPQCKEQQRVPGSIMLEPIEDDPPKPAKRSASRNPLKKKVSPVVVFAVVGGLLALGLIGSQMEPRHRDGTARETKSKKMTLRVKSGGGVPVAASEAAFERFSKLATANDTTGIERMLNLGLVMTVPSGTEVLVIDRGFLKSEVRIMEGTRSGQAVWVASDFLSRE